VALVYGTGDDFMSLFRLTDGAALGVPGSSVFDDPRTLTCETSTSYSRPVLDDDMLLLAIGPRNGCFAARAFGLPLNRSRPPTRFGQAWDVFPDTDDRVWIVRSAHTMWFAHRADLQGTAVGRPVPLPHRPIAHVHGGFLVVSSVGGERSEIDVVSDSTGRLVRSLTRRADEALAVSRDHVVWRDGPYDCRRCAVHITDTSTGSDRVITLPLQTEGPIAAAAFSPDGRSLVLSFQQVGGRAGIAVLVDTRSGASSIVPGSAGIEPWLTTGGVVWAPSGKRFFFLDAAPTWRSGDDFIRTGTYRLGARRCAVIAGTATLPQGMLLAVPASITVSS
jgi:hypothetical protein